MSRWWPKDKFLVNAAKALGILENNNNQENMNKSIYELAKDVGMIDEIIKIEAGKADAEEKEAKKDEIKTDTRSKLKAAKPAESAKPAEPVKQAEPVTPATPAEPVKQASNIPEAPLKNIIAELIKDIDVVTDSWLNLNNIFIKRLIEKNQKILKDARYKGLFLEKMPELIDLEEEDIKTWFKEVYKISEENKEIIIEWNKKRERRQSWNWTVSDFISDTKEMIYSFRKEVIPSDKEGEIEKSALEEKIKEWESKIEKLWWISWWEEFISVAGEGEKRLSDLKKLYLNKLINKIYDTLSPLGITESDIKDLSDDKKEEILRFLSNEEDFLEIRDKYVKKKEELELRLIGYKAAKFTLGNIKDYKKIIKTVDQDYDKLVEIITDVSNFNNTEWLNLLYLELNITEKDWKKKEWIKKITESNGLKLIKLYATYLKYYWTIEPNFKKMMELFEKREGLSGWKGWNPYIAETPTVESLKKEVEELERKG